MSTRHFKTLDGGILQDIHHHSLAMIGQENGMDANTLKRRIECADRVYEMLSCWPVCQIAEYQECLATWNSINSEAEMQRLGKLVHEVNKRVAALMGIDSNCGDAPKFYRGDRVKVNGREGKVICVQTPKYAAPTAQVCVKFADDGFPLEEWFTRIDLHLQNTF